MIKNKYTGLSRHFWILTGDRQAMLNSLQQQLPAMEQSALVVTPVTDDFSDLPVVSCKQVSIFLGQEKSLVFIDLYDQVCVDAIAIAAGLVVGGGHLVFCMPDKTQWPDRYPSLFSQRMLRFLPLSNARYIAIEQSHDYQQFMLAIRQPVESNDFRITPDQQQLIDGIHLLAKENGRQSLVAVADRGRGKSTSLGLVAAQLMQHDKINILITAPSFKASAVAFQYAADRLGINKVKQAMLTYDLSCCRFIAPDELLEQQPEADLVFIDEAAAIPLPMLKQIQQQYEKTVFVSTVHGYEGTGRGFFIRFFKMLNDSGVRWQQLEMKLPVRWSEDDLLEPWLFKWLCLDADIPEINIAEINSSGIDSAADKPGLQPEKINLENISLKKITQQQLAENEDVLRQLFALLVMAHYRTRPSDLQRLLDDSVEIRLAEFNGKVIGAVLSIDEGGFDAELAAQVYRGERRPQGHLLAQTLSYHCGVAEAARYRMRRIMRIVVHPQLQHRGIGSLMLNQLVEAANTDGIDLVGASFGYTEQLANFWQASDFSLVRIGFSQEHSSGERSALFIKALNKQGNAIEEKARRRFVHHLPYLKRFILKDIALNGIASAMQQDQLTADDREDIESFINSQRSYELCIAGVNKWLAMHLSRLEAMPEQYLGIIHAVTTDCLHWKAAATRLGLQGKKQAESLFKQAVIFAWQQINQL